MHVRLAMYICVHWLLYVGQLFDKNGVRRMWWSDHSQAEFQSRLQCFVDQYNQFRVMGVKVWNYSENHIGVTSDPECSYIHCKDVCITARYMYIVLVDMHMLGYAELHEPSLIHLPYSKLNNQLPNLLCSAIIIFTPELLSQNERNENSLINWYSNIVACMAYFSILCMFYQITAIDN